MAGDAQQPPPRRDDNDPPPKRPETKRESSKPDHRDTEKTSQKLHAETEPPEKKATTRTNERATETGSAEPNEHLAPLFDGLESAQDVRARLARLKSPDVNVSPVIDGQLGEAGRFNFDNGIVQYRGQGGVRTEFPQNDNTPTFNGERIQSIMQTRDGRIALQTDAHPEQRFLSPEQQRQLEASMPVVLQFQDGGNEVRVLANGNKEVTDQYGRTTTQFSP